MKEFLLNEIKATGTTTGDVYFPETKLLLPFNGLNGATSTSDSSNNNVAVNFVGTSQISTVQSKFGESSLLFDGNSDYLTVNNSSFGSFTGSTFTVEFWVYHNSLSGLIYYAVNYSGGSNGVIVGKNSSHVLISNLTGGGVDITGTTAMTTGQWYHVALSGSSGSYKLFLDGNLEGSSSSSGSTGSNTWYLGAWVYSSTLYYPLDGYLDDIRFTSGVARYTSAFTAPTTAHLTSAGDVNKQIIVNSTADGVAIGTGGINQARIAKAWVNWNGTGTVAIRDSYNVSSMSDRGTGKYTINFSTAMSDTNYSGAGNAGLNNSNGGADNFNRCLHFTPYTTSAAYANSFIGDASSPSLSDCHVCTLLVFGN